MASNSSSAVKGHWLGWKGLLDIRHPSTNHVCDYNCLCIYSFGLHFYHRHLWTKLVNLKLFVVNCTLLILIIIYIIIYNYIYMYIIYYSNRSYMQNIVRGCDVARACEGYIRSEDTKVRSYILYIVWTC